MKAIECVVGRKVQVKYHSHRIEGEIVGPVSQTRRGGYEVLVKVGNPCTQTWKGEYWQEKLVPIRMLVQTTGDRLSIFWAFNDLVAGKGNSAPVNERIWKELEVKATARWTNGGSPDLFAKTAL